MQEIVWAVVCSLFVTMTICQFWILFYVGSFRFKIKEAGALTILVQVGCFFILESVGTIRDIECEKRRNVQVNHIR